MEGQKPDEPLPSGWRVEVKVRKNGRKDKCYVNRAKGLKFYSKVELIRHLNEKRVKSEEKNNSTIIETADNVVTEKGGAEEGLPPGWIKEIKITKSGRNVRKDPYYTDPVSGYVFRSLKNAQRFVETGEVGRNTIRCNGRSNDDEELKKDIKFSSPIVVKEQKLVVDEATPITDKSLKSENLLQDEQSGGSKLKRKKDVNLPRRASKRLAGIELEPTPEVKIGNRTRRTLMEYSDEGVAGKSESPASVSKMQKASLRPDKIEDERKPKYAFEISKITEVSVESDERENLSADLGTSNGSLRTVRTETQSNGNGRDVDTSKNGEILTGFNDTEVSETALDLPLADLWTDPCIAFAIQTLTGKSFDIPNSAEVSPLTNPRLPSDAYGEKEETQNQCTGGNDQLFRDNRVNGGNSEMIQNNSVKMEEKPGSPLDLPYADIWRDPCIEFAIKTLTGAIPVGCNDPDYIQQPLAASQPQVGGGGGLPLHDAGVDNFCHTDYLCNQYDITEKPACVNFSVGNSEGVYRFGNGRRNEFHR